MNINNECKYLDELIYLKTNCTQIQKIYARIQVPTGHSMDYWDGHHFMYRDRAVQTTFQYLN